MNISVLTLNLHTYQQHACYCPFETMHHHEREVHIIADAIKRENIDIICFQEVGEYLHDPISQPYGATDSNMANRIRNRLAYLGLHYEIFQDWSHIGFNRWREGTAILSRFPMRHNHSAYVSYDQRKDNYMSRNVTLSCIDVPWFGLLHIANVHLSWGHHGFFEEYQRLKHLINSRYWLGSRGDLIVGDFNAPAGSEAYRHIVEHEEYVDQFYCMHPQRFFEPSYRGQIDGWRNRPPHRIDYVFKRRASPLHIYAMDVIFNDCFYPKVSDHFGYVARFWT